MLAPKMTTALEVAVLVKCLPDIQQAADLIQQYANSVAAAKSLEDCLDMRNRIFSKLEGGVDA